MVIRDILKYFENWAPAGAAWEKDNVGLLIGSENEIVNKIFLTLELNEAALQSAIKNKCNLIITHHPLIFHAINKLNFDRSIKNRLIRTLIRNNIALFSAHTNLDFTRDGVSFTLAEKLGLKEIEFLLNQDSNQYKVTVFVPQDYVDKLSQALFDAGAGVIGDYEKCSFKLKGIGTFQGNESTNPFLGSRQSFEQAEEIRLEVLVNQWNLKKVIGALLKNHPYEEPAYDVYPLKNSNVNYGAGATGILPTPMRQAEFLDYVSRKINSKNIRYCNGKRGKIKKVAVCGGSCSNMLNRALAIEADAFITADVSYHTFEEARGRILLVDAGHYETEIHVVEKIRKRLSEFLKETNENIEIVTYSGNTNPVKFLIK